MSFSNSLSKLAIVGAWNVRHENERVSVSQFSHNGHILVAVALERKTERGWEIDPQHAHESTVSQEAWAMTGEFVTEVMISEVYKAVTGSAPGMGYRRVEAPK